ncbi:hypothetical protein FWF48_02180 [Candidatus Saccharibacteria bacterium]|nr:hypothetical protein [Candidatus Saccharibacteria bacterium]
MRTIPYNAEHINPPDFSNINPEDYRYYARRYTHEPEISDQIGYIMPSGEVLSEPFAFNGFNHNMYGITEAVPIAGAFFDYLFHTYHGTDSTTWDERIARLEEWSKQESYDTDWPKILGTNLDQPKTKQHYLRQATNWGRFYDIFSDGFNVQKANEWILEEREAGTSFWSESIHDGFDHIYANGQSSYQIQRQEFVIQRDLMAFLKPVFGSHLNVHEALGGLDSGWNPNFEVNIHPVTIAPDDERARGGKIRAYTNRMYPVETYAQPIKTILVQVLGYDAIERTDKTITTSCNNPNERFHDYILMGWTIHQVPKYAWDNKLDKYTEAPAAGAAVMRQELELAEELVKITADASLEERAQFFENSESHLRDIGQVVIARARKDGQLS